MPGACRAFPMWPFYPVYFPPLEESALRKVLVPVDGSAPAHRAVRHVVALAGRDPSFEAVLLNVQPEVDEWSVRRVLRPEEIEAMEVSRGGDVLRPECGVLKAAGVRFTPLVAIGQAAETIVSVATEQGCDGIVMGTRGQGLVAGVLMGSVSTQVLRLTGLPVMLIK